MKRIILYVCLIISSFNSFAQIPSTEDSCRTIMLSNEAEKFMEVRNKLLDTIANAISHGVALDTIREASLEAVANGDHQRLYSLLFSSTQSGQDFFQSYVDAKNDVLEANPWYLNALDSFTCRSCSTTLAGEVNYFYDNFSSFNAYRYDPNEGSDLPTCGSWRNQLKLLICAAACGASTAGIGAALCGWGCWCWFCSKNSVLSNVICPD